MKGGGISTIWDFHEQGKQKKWFDPVLEGTETD